MYIAEFESSNLTDTSGGTMKKLICCLAILTLTEGFAHASEALDLAQQLARQGRSVRFETREFVDGNSTKQDVLDQIAQLEALAESLKDALHSSGGEVSREPGAAGEA